MKLQRLISLFLLLTILLTCLASCKDGDSTTAKEQIKGKNLIYIIGDGMGFNHIENTKLYMGVDTLPFEQYYVGEVTTYSADNAITDSAASATALSTGVKTNNDVVGLDAAGNVLKNIMELSKDNGRKTAVVTTDVVHGATPGGFSGHATRRTDKFSIMDSQIAGAVDLYLAQYDSSARTYRNKYINADFQYAESFADLEDFSKDQKIFGNIKNVDSPYDPSLTDVVSLKSMVEYALDYLTTNNDTTFTLMVEGAYIDKNNHNNEIFKMMYALMDLSDTVEYVLEWAKDRDDTVVIFTADHESGGLKLADSKDTLRNGLYTSDDHTAANVPLYVYGMAAPQSLIDNTDVYKIAESAVLWKEEN